MSNSTAVKPKLADVLRTQLEESYGSVTKACEVQRLPYERIRKALQRNRFSLSDLEALLPEKDIEKLQREFEFTLVRPYGQKCSEEGRTSFISAIVTEGVTANDIVLVQENKLVARRVAAAIKKECESIRMLLGIS